MRLLNLCSGTGSVSIPFKQAAWDVIEVDWDPRYKPTHVVDLMTWECPYEPGHFDVVWASPDCAHYSIARTTAKTPRDLVNADALVQRCLDLIQMLEAKVWWSGVTAVPEGLRAVTREDATLQMLEALQDHAAMLGCIASTLFMLSAWQSKNKDAWPSQPSGGTYAEIAETVFTEKQEKPNSVKNIAKCLDSVKLITFLI